MRNIDVAPDPFADCAIGYPDRYGADQKAPVFPVPPAQAPFRLVGQSPHRRAGPGSDSFFARIRVYRREPTHAQDLLAALAGKGSPGGLVLDHLPAGIRGPHDLGYGRDQSAATLRVEPHGFFGGRAGHLAFPAAYTHT